MLKVYEAALIGTAKAGTHNPAVSDAIDPLLSHLSVLQSEKRLLLTAGLLSVYGRAGYVPSTMPPLEPARHETLTACSKGVGEILRTILERPQIRRGLDAVAAIERSAAPSALGAEHGDLLPEALALLAERRLRLRHVLLPRVLSARDDALRQALLPVIGERGHWLARFNPAWSWALDTKRDPDTHDADPEMERIWQEGKSARRLELLKRQRAFDPAAARERLEEVFAAERFDVRIALLGALQVNLSPSDEPFLESALDDRHALVRLQAANLLAQLPTSACAARLRARANTMLDRAKGGRLLVTPPPDLDPDWSREGLEPSGRGPGIDSSGFWMLQTIGLVPVRHWIERFSAALDELTSSLHGDRELEVLEAWTRAAVLHRETQYFSILWDAWWKRRHSTFRYAHLLPELLSELVHDMPAADVQPRLNRLLIDPHLADKTTAGRVAGRVACPWPDGLGDACVRLFRQIARELARGKTPSESWLYVVLPCARGTPPQFIGKVLEQLDRFDVPDDTPVPWQDVLSLAQDKLRLRRRLYEELTR